MTDHLAPVSTEFFEDDLVFSFYLKTNGAVDAERFVEFIAALANHARMFYGDFDTRLEIIEMRSGSIFTKFRVWLNADPANPHLVGYGLSAAALLAAVIGPMEPAAPPSDVQICIINILQQDNVSQIDFKAKDFNVSIDKIDVAGWRHDPVLESDIIEWAQRVGNSVSKGHVEVVGPIFIRPVAPKSGRQMIGFTDPETGKYLEVGIVSWNAEPLPRSMNRMTDRFVVQGQIGSRDGKNVIIEAESVTPLVR